MSEVELPEWAASHWEADGVTYVKDANGSIYAGPYPTDSEGVVWMEVDGPVPDPTEDD